MAKPCVAPPLARLFHDCFMNLRHFTANSHEDVMIGAGLQIEGEVDALDAAGAPRG